MNLNKKQREALRIKYGGFCSYCGCPLTGKWHVDHVQAVRRDGQWKLVAGGKMEYVSLGTMSRPQHDTMENLSPACVPCNINKGVLELEQWRKILERSAHTLHANYSTYRHALRFGLIVETPPTLKFHFETYRPRKRITTT